MWPLIERFQALRIIYTHTHTHSHALGVALGALEQYQSPFWNGMRILETPENDIVEEKNRHLESLMAGPEDPEGQPVELARLS